MPQVEQSIEIQAPPAAVFALIADQPERVPEWWPSFELQQRVTPAPTAIGSVSRYVYNMMGIRIKGETQVLQMDGQSRLVVKTISGIDSMYDYRFAPLDGGGTLLTVRVAYALPGSVLGQLLNRHTMEQKYEHDLERGLQTLKALIEAEAQP
ncbi:MAG TPA: SRPBCC family protein [Phototrophicaceae bacterium]|nr:SRPBCC family protein [Phototrophicaceae bacterium]